MTPAWPRLRLFWLLLFAFLCLPATTEAGQLGALLSPGTLARAHKDLEGAQCQKCHQAGRQVSAERCLTCHKPIADRIAAHKGVHRQVTDCVACHVEHAGVDAELRHLDTRTFNHASETGFPLTGVHAKTAANCASCHKGRSFLDARPACGSCHTDPHKGALGASCTTCHSTTAPFKRARAQFDHSTAKFQLVGAHQRVACEQCHKNGTFKGVAFSTCTACHTEPHEKRFGATCTSCHSPETWKTKTVDHARTAFPLTGAHVRVACTQCHTSPKMTAAIKSDRCSACHANVHRDSITGECSTCHTTSSFKGATFDHGAQTSFALVGRHDGLACVKCHTGVSDDRVPLSKRSADFSGLDRACVTCHEDKDAHNGTFGRACDSCHRPATFATRDFRHPRDEEFFGGHHQQVTCASCHVPDRAVRPSPAASPSMACASCHSDAHLGQLGSACNQCHTVEGSGFKALAFSHGRARLPLTGKHATLECVKCHVSETGVFPARTGTAVRFKPIAPACSTCHKDPHLGQFAQSCDSCHSTTTFALSATYVHKDLADFFAGFHGRYACKDCHKQERGQFPAGDGVAVRFIVGRTCAACHRY